MEIEDRFWRYVDHSGGPDACWPWTYSMRKDGYGFLSVKFQKVRAHRLSWEIHNGPIPPGLRILHLCDNPPCVNPAHLYAGTAADNTRDMMIRGRHYTGTRRRGMAMPNALLTDDIVRLIRRTPRYVPIARQLGVSPSTVSLVRRGLSWKHVE